MKFHCFCVDYFVTALEQGAPELGIKDESRNLRRTVVVADENKCL
jgi:hypothetical protein